MKYRITFNETVEDRDNVTHGGVTFKKGKATEVDSTKVELSPWFEGNPSFTLEALADETTQTEVGHGNAAEDSRANSAGEGAGSRDEGDSKENDEPTDKPVTKRSRKKAVTK